MQCPECSKPLHPASYAGIQLDRCRSCGGIWFDAGEIEAYRRARNEVDTPRNVTPLDEPARSCPRCESLSLEAGEASSTRIYRCSQCRGKFLPTQPSLGEMVVGEGKHQSDGLLLEGAFQIVGELLLVVFDG